MSLFGGILDFAGDLLGAHAQEETNDSNMSIARQQMQFQSEEAEKMRDFNEMMTVKSWHYGDSVRAAQEAFQERMSNSAFQRAMKDMDLAGLNPILAYKTGGASTPMGASSSNVFSGQGSSPAGASAVMRSVMADRRASAVAALRNEAEIENIEQDTRLKEANRVLTNELTGRAGDEARKFREQAQNEEVLRETLKSQNVTAKAEAERAGIIQQFMESDIGKWIVKFGTAGKEINPLLGSGNAARNFIGR